MVPYFKSDHSAVLQMFNKLHAKVMTQENSQEKIIENTNPKSKKLLGHTTYFSWILIFNFWTLSVQNDTDGYKTYQAMITSFLLIPYFT